MPFEPPIPTRKYGGPSFGVMVFLTILCFPLGIIATIGYSCAGKRAHAILMAVVTLAVGMFSYALFNHFKAGAF